MSFALAAAVAASAVTLPSCSWDRPGVNPFVGDVVAAIDRYTDMPAATRSALKKRVAERRYDEIVVIKRDTITGRHSYGPQIRDMHFGTGQVCGTVTRARWTQSAEELGLVYCEAGDCVMIPTVCRNLSRIVRLPTRVASAAEEPDEASGERQRAALPAGGAGGAGGGGGTPGAGADAGAAQAPGATAQAMQAAGEGGALAGNPEIAFEAPSAGGAPGLSTGGDSSFERLAARGLLVSTALGGGGNGGGGLGPSTFGGARGNGPGGPVGLIGLGGLGGPGGMGGAAGPIGGDTGRGAPINPPVEPPFPALFMQYSGLLPDGLPLAPEFTTPVPEPSAALLLLGGLAALGWRARRVMRLRRERQPAPPG